MGKWECGRRKRTNGKRRAFGDKEHIAGLPPLYINTFLCRRRFNNSVSLRENSVVKTNKKS
jgi:hypothetical protein